MSADSVYLHVYHKATKAPLLEHFALGKEKKWPRIFVQFDSSDVFRYDVQPSAKRTDHPLIIVTAVITFQGDLQPPPLFGYP